MSSVWDPLGFVSPFVVRGRVFHQELWTGMMWDDAVDEERLQVWAKFEQEARSLDELTFARCYRRQKEAANDFQLVFSDSSAKAKCAVAYYRFVYESDDVDVTLITARTRVTPLKKQTIARLELDALRMGVNLATAISGESDIEVKRVVFLTDSIIYKYWLTQPSRRYKDFLEKTESLVQKGLAVEVLYVPSEMNAAVIVTRGAMLTDLDSTVRG